MPRHRWTRTNHKARVSETVARPTRTTVMYAVAVAIVAFWDTHVSHLDKTGKAVALGVALALVNAAWVAGENYLGAGVLRNVPPKSVAVVDGGNDVPHGEVGAGELGLVIGVLLVIILVVVLLRLT